MSDFKTLPDVTLPGASGVLLLVQGAETTVGVSDGAPVVLRRVGADKKTIGGTFRLRASVVAEHGPKKNAPWCTVPASYVPATGQHLEARTWGTADRFRQLVDWKTFTSLVALASAVLALVLALMPEDKTTDALTKVAAAHVDADDSVALAWPRNVVPGRVPTLQALGVRDVPVVTASDGAGTPTLLPLARRVPLQADVARLAAIRRFATRTATASCGLRLETRTFEIRVAMINGAPEPSSDIPECGRKVAKIEQPKVTSSIDTSKLYAPVLALLSAVVAAFLVVRELWRFQVSE